MVENTQIQVLKPMNGSAERSKDRGFDGSRTGMLDRIAKKLRSCVRTSRSLLLGSRDPRGPSCVPVVKPGDIEGSLPTNLGDYDGGAGTTLAILYFGDRLNCKTPVDDYNWHQGRLRTFLENAVSTNSNFLEEFSELADNAQAFAQDVRTLQSWPDDLATVGYTDFGSWP